MRSVEPGRAGFHSASHIFPPGFTTNCTFASAVTRGSTTRYTCTIADGGAAGPLFVAAAADAPGRQWVGPSPAAVWQQIAQQVMPAARCRVALASLHHAAAAAEKAQALRSHRRCCWPLLLQVAQANGAPAPAVDGDVLFALSNPLVAMLIQVSRGARAACKHCASVYWLLATSAARPLLCSARPLPTLCPPSALPVLPPPPCRSCLVRPAAPPSSPSGLLHRLAWWQQ